jgi:hypothetical protein
VEVRNRTWRLSSAAAAAAILMLLGGCGGDPAAPPDTQEVADLGTPPLGAESAPAKVAETTAEPAPVVETRTVTEKKRIRYSTREVKDSSLPEGTRRTRTRGRDGVRALTYEVTFTDGEPSGRKLVSSEVIRKPVTKVVAVGTKVEKDEPSGDCDPNYSGACVPVASDVDCAGGSGNGPEYVDGPVRVVGDDVYDLDRDGDGIACD